MIRLFLTKIFIIFSISQPIASDDNENAFNFINENAVYFLTIIKTEGSKYDEKPDEFKEKLKNIWDGVTIFIFRKNRTTLCGIYNKSPCSKSSSNLS